jgi:hypothetical protein
LLVATDKALGQPVTQPATRGAEYIDVPGLKTDFLLEFAEHRLLRRFVGTNTALRKLPGILMNTTRPQQPPVAVGQNNANIGPIPIEINHLNTRLSCYLGKFIVHSAVAGANRRALICVFF